jgi:phosphatidylglycerophosphate synthase
LIKSRFGTDLDRILQRLFPFLFRARIDPNALTWIGTAVSGLAAFAIATGELLVGGLLILAGGFFDLVDGVVARHRGCASEYGGFLDSSLDRLVDLMLFLGVILFLATEGDRLGLLLAAIALIGSVMTSYIKARAELRGPPIEIGFFERAERILVLAAGLLSGWLEAALWILAFGSVYTAVVRFRAAGRGLRGLAPLDERPGGSP